MPKIASSSFSFVIVLSVLLVAANNVPISHGQATVADLSVTSFVTQIQKLDMGIDSALIITSASDIVGQSVTLVQITTSSVPALTSNVLILRSGTATPILKSDITTFNTVGDDVCRRLNMFPGPILSAFPKRSELGTAAVVAGCFRF